MTDVSSNGKRVDRHRDRERSRPAPYHVDVLGSRPGGNKAPPYNRIFVSNIPYDERWQDLKDLFREKVGEVTYVELMTDADGNSKGYGIVEFKTKELAVEAVEKMRGHVLKDRNLVVKEDFYGDFLNKSLRRDGLNASGTPSNPGLAMPQPLIPTQGHLPMPDHRQSSYPPPLPQNMGNRNEFPQVTSVEQKIMDITGGAKVGKTVFVANLDYSVTYPKLKEVFSLAGKISKLDLHLDRDNKSRGMATITFETALEALQSISMFNKQMLYDRPMVVKMDRENTPGTGLPSGLQSIGPSLNLPGLGRDDVGSGSGGYGDAPRDVSDPLRELEAVTAKKKLLEESLAAAGLMGRGIPNTNLGTSNFSGIPGLVKPKTGPDSLAGSLDFLNQQSNNSPRYVSAVLGDFSASQQYRDYQSNDHNQSHGVKSILGLQTFDRSRGSNVYSQYSSIPKQSNERVLNTSGVAGRHITSVAVVNLPYSVTWMELKRHFSEVGNVLFAQIKMENGKSKGQAQVRFASSEEAINAVRRFNNTEFEGRNLKVRLDDSRH